MGPEFIPPDVSRQNTNAIRDPPLGNVYEREAFPPVTVISPISAKSTHNVQRWMATPELTVASRFTGTPAVAVMGVTDPIVGFANAAKGVNNPKMVERARVFFIFIY